MMSVKKMIVFGAASIVTVSLIGCKDDDDSACDYGTSPSEDDLKACLECQQEKVGSACVDNAAASGCAEKFLQALKDCGGSAVTDVTDVDAEDGEAAAQKLQCIAEKATEFMTANPGTVPTEADRDGFAAAC